MAKGKLIIEFDSADDLLCQLRAMTNAGAVHARAEARPPEPKMPEARQTDVERTLQFLQQVHDEQARQADVGRTLASTHVAVPAALETVVTKAVADNDSKLKVAQPVASQAPQAPQGAFVAKPLPPAQSEVTLETLASLPYEVLLTFCSAHPDVGVRPEQAQSAVMRPLVEHRIRNYLSTPLT